MTSEYRATAIVCGLGAVVLGCLGVWAFLHLPPPVAVSDVLLHVSVGLATVAAVFACAFMSISDWRAANRKQ